MDESKPPADRATAGFTLIEILVAFTVAALLLAALYQIFSTGLRSSASAENYANAVLLAESGLDALAGSAIAVGQTTDRISGYERTTIIRPRPELEPANTQVALKLYEVEVRVAWRDGVRERSVSLSTLRAGPREVSQ